MKLSIVFLSVLSIAVSQQQVYRQYNPKFLWPFDYYPRNVYPSYEGYQMIDSDREVEV